MITSDFNCSQANLIVVVQTGLNSYFQFLSHFTDFSTIYDKAWGDTLLTKLENAAAMPDADTLQSESEAKRNELVRDCRAGRQEWQKLKRHSSKVFESDVLAIKLKAAGGNLYETASNEGWPEAQQMFTNAINFIEVNKEILLKVMPPSFPENFENVVKTYKKALADYNQSKEAVSEGTQARVKALNNVYHIFMDMMLDGQAVFEGNEAVRKQFVFAEVLSKVSGPGLAGIRGIITSAINATPLSNATITITDRTGKQIATATTDAEGKYVANTASGTYKVDVAANGFISRTIDDFTVDIGTVSKLDVALSSLESEDI